MIAGRLLATDPGEGRRASHPWDSELFDHAHKMIHGRKPLDPRPHSVRGAAGRGPFASRATSAGMRPQGHGGESTAPVRDVSLSMQTYSRS